ncbi:putative nuclease HARBI1 [Pleurodeles waltl]|uniref:putative nuclease HARBI1 n=1 Tax=Pleurodeles waltl TaxID=8319 RepID=UPI003709C3F2
MTPSATSTTAATSNTTTAATKAVQKEGENIPHTCIHPGLRNEEVIRLYRLKRESNVRRLHHIAPDITARVESPKTIPPMIRLLAILHMLMSGSFQTTAAQVDGTSQPSLSAFLPMVLDVIICLTPFHIQFHNAQQLQQETKQGFYQMVGFPHCIEQHKLKWNITIIDRSCVGMDTSQHTNYHTPDQGYSIQPWVILTPYGNPQTDAEQTGNETYKRTRNVAERAFGLLKSRFKCVSLTGGSLLHAPPLVCKLILVCAILHNICVHTIIPWDEQVDVPSEEDEDNDAEQEDGEQSNSAAGARRRDQIVHNFFT